MRWLALFLATVISFSMQANGPILKRICISGNDNNLYWISKTDTCIKHYYTLIIGRNGASGAFQIIDTVRLISTEIYTHTNANIGPGTPNWQYFLLRIDSCASGIVESSSDTLKVDNTKTTQTYFDSVSVDPYANNIKLGWRNNPSNDFDKFFLYTYKSGIYTSILSGGTKDTFYTDANNNPSAGSVTYDINTTDSCGNPSFLGESLHTTIYLQSSIDTCNYRYTLFWSPYIGWSKVKQYLIYEDSLGTPKLIGTVVANTTTFTEKYQPAKTQKFFIRAVKDTSILITSSSNFTSFTTPNQTLPTKLGFNYISSNNPLSNQVIVSVFSDPNNNSQTYRIKQFDKNYVLEETLLVPSTNINNNIVTSATDQKQHFFTIEALNWCGNIGFVGDTSCNILLQVDDLINKRNLMWNKYFTWNNGINTYQINRGTGDIGNILFSPVFNTQDSFLTDSDVISNIESEGICYQVEAIEKSPGNNKSLSNVVCIGKTDAIYIPNAFVPNGVNKLFRPEGSMINYATSEIEIYNKWGEQIYYNKINNGWDGSMIGKPCEQGVYIYKMKIVKTNNETITKSGTVTIFR